MVEKFVAESVDCEIQMMHFFISLKLHSSNIFFVGGKSFSDRGSFVWYATCRPIFLFVLKFSDKRYSKDQSIITEIVCIVGQVIQCSD